MREAFLARAGVFLARAGAFLVVARLVAAAAGAVRGDLLARVGAALGLMGDESTGDQVRRRGPVTSLATVQAMTEPVHRALGLTDDEALEIERILGREPNHLELAMYAVMWSEHCSYKSSRIHLKRLPTEAPWVLVGPGENAGVVDVGDGIAAAIRIESHNHPSAIEPYQGAATGVGGILRDIFTMGARPIALMDPLRFGPLDDAAEPVDRGRRGGGHLRLRQRRRRADRRRRDRVRRHVQRQPARQRAVPRRAAEGSPRARSGQRRRQPRRAARLDDGP